MVLTIFGNLAWRHFELIVFIFVFGFGFLGFAFGHFLDGSQAPIGECVTSVSSFKFSRSFFLKLFLTILYDTFISSCVNILCGCLVFTG